MGFLTALWTFANSPVGMSVALWVSAKLFVKTIKSKDRRAAILQYADQAFLMLEAIGPQLGLKGHEKYVRFISTIVDALKAAGQGELTAGEVSMLKGLAERKAWIARTPALIK